MKSPHTRFDRDHNINPRRRAAGLSDLPGLPRTTALLLALLGGWPACAEKVVSKVQACPCATGNVCCQSGVCAADQNLCGSATLALAAESAGVWTGYFENFNLPSGSDALKISLSVDGDLVSGELVLGTANEPPPPMRPASVPDAGIDYDGGGIPGEGYVEGYRFQLQDLRWESRRMKFTVKLGDYWKPLCDSYQPVTVAGQTFICPSGWSSGPGAECALDDGTPIDCNLLQPCVIGGPCQCTDTSCTPAAGELKVDVALRGDNGDGTANLNYGNNVNIRLVRSSR